MKRVRVQSVAVVTLRGDALAHACSFLDPIDLSRATSVSCEWRTIRGRLWAKNMLQRGAKRLWCMEREREIEAGYDETTGDLAHALRESDFASVDGILACDQRYFTGTMISNTAVNIRHAKATAASVLNPFVAPEPTPTWGCSYDLEVQIYDLRCEFELQLQRMIPHIDRLSLDDFKLMWGSFEAGEITKAQSLEYRKQRLSWLS